MFNCFLAPIMLPLATHHTIDLTLEDNDYNNTDNNGQSNSSPSHDLSSDVEIVLHPSPATSRRCSKMRKQNTARISVGPQVRRINPKRSGKESIVVMNDVDPRPSSSSSSTPRASRSGRATMYKTDHDHGPQSSSSSHSKFQPMPLDDDERLARKLAEEEQAEIERLALSVKKRNDGIVFKVAVDATTHTLEDGSPAHPDDIARFQPWKDLFEKSGFKVKRFHWIVNVELHERFEKARRTLKYLMDKDPQEKMLFHGTAAQNIDSILSSGFRIGGVNGHPCTNGQALGVGIYLASSADVSIGYGAGADRIFACRVLPGRITGDGRYSMRIPPGTELGNERYECFHSGIEDDQETFVVRYASLVLPCYMIEYDANQNMNRKPVYSFAGLGLGGFGNINGLLAASTSRQYATTIRPRKRVRNFDDIDSDGGDYDDFDSERDFENFVGRIPEEKRRKTS